MNMDGRVIALIALIVLVVVATYMKSRNESKAQLLRDIKKEVAYLFLFAEKQDWVDEDKMKWVVDIVYKQYPAIGLLLKEETVEFFVARLYEEFKAYAENLVVPSTPVVDPTPTPAPVVTPAEPVVVVTPVVDTPVAPVAEQTDTK